LLQWVEGAVPFFAKRNNNNNKPLLLKQTKLERLTQDDHLMGVCGVFHSRTHNSRKQRASELSVNAVVVDVSE
jgi:hypothetical protein